jgi:hypothetical protein
MSLSTKQPSESVSYFDDKELCSYIHERTEIIVLGASGDLAKKKTYPALLDLYSHGFLSDNVSDEP